MVLLLGPALDSCKGGVIARFFLSSGHIFNKDLRGRSLSQNARTHQYCALIQQIRTKVGQSIQINNLHHLVLTNTERRYDYIIQQ